MKSTSAAELLRAATRREHEQAEHSRFMTDLVDGRLNAGAWLLLLEQLQPVYAALETVAGQWRRDPELAPLLHPGLDRSAAIAADLAELRLQLGVEARPPRPCAERYRARILSCADSPARFVAQHYTRYLGDLSGGQILRVRFQQHYGLKPEQLRFFVFDALPPGPVFKKSYRAALDAWAIDATRQDALVDEARVAFHLNQAVFEDLADCAASMA